MEQRATQAGAELSGARALRELVADAIELEPATRDAYLVTNLSSDAELRAARSLLRAYETAERGGLFEAPGDAREVRLGKIGPYTLGAKLGEGAFGAVYRATQDAPVKRTVAIKVLRVGLLTPEVEARWGLETRSLAMLDHPGVARVIDSGRCGDGTPYLVMEFVDGVGITEFCQRRGMGVRERVGLVVQAARALQHAHTKGVVHRDIKPGNLLVRAAEHGPELKIIDFGVAKIVDESQPASGAGITTARQIVGTPEYMSPEQSAGEADIDTRTDIYALGVVLYELLAGALPIPADVLRKAGAAGLAEILATHEPAKPSLRAGDRATARALAGELDWVVLRCLEKDRRRRYETAAALADDLERYLRDEAVLATPPSVAYRWGKFARKNKVGLIAASAVLAALLGGLALALDGQRAARRALTRESEQRARAQAERRTAERTSGFLQKVLAGADPYKGAQDKKVREILDDAGALIIGGELHNEPEVEAAARRALGQSYLALNIKDKGREHLEAALKLSEREGFDPTQRALTLMAWSHIEADQNDFQRVYPLDIEALGILDRVAPEGNEHTLLCLGNLINSAWNVAKPEEAEAYRARAIALAERLYGVGSVRAVELRAMGISAVHHTSGGSAEQSKSIIDAFHASGITVHPKLTTLYRNIAHVAMMKNDLNGGVRAFDAAREIEVACYGPAHRNVLWIDVERAHLFSSFGMHEEAARISERALPAALASEKPGESELLAEFYKYVANYEKDHNTERAIEMLEKSFEARSRLSYENFGSTMAALQYAQLMIVKSADDPNSAEIEKARTRAQQILDIPKGFMPATDWSRTLAMCRLGQIKIIENDFVGAEALLLESLREQDSLKIFRMYQHSFGLESCAALIKLYEEWDAAQPGQGHAAKAEPYRERARTHREAHAQGKAKLDAIAREYKAGKQESEGVSAGKSEGK